MSNQPFPTDPSAPGASDGVDRTPPSRTRAVESVFTHTDPGQQRPRSCPPHRAPAKRDIGDIRAQSYDADQYPFSAQPMTAPGEWRVLAYHRPGVANEDRLSRRAAFARARTLNAHYWAARG